MIIKWELLDYKTIRYTLNSSNNWYQLQTKPEGFKKLPNELKVRLAICPIIREKSTILIEGHTVNKLKEFFTSLCPTQFENLYYGDDSYNKPQKKSFILFHFSNDKIVLTCYYFNDFMIASQVRNHFIEAFRQSIKQ